MRPNPLIPTRVLAMRSSLTSLSFSTHAKSSCCGASRSGLRVDTAGRRGSSEDDLPLRLNHAQDRGVGRGLNPAPDERRPAASEYDDWTLATTIRRES